MNNESDLIPTENNQTVIAAIDPSIVPATAQSLRPSQDLYIYHNSPDFRQSIVMWNSACNRFVMGLRAFVLETEVHTSLFMCKDAPKLLNGFCQTIQLSAPVENLTFTAIAVVLQSLLMAYDGEKGIFDSQQLCFGLKSFQTADRKRQSQRIARLAGERIPLERWGNNAIAHVNNAMKESHGLCHWSIQGTGEQNWACNLMIDVESDAYREEFENCNLPGVNFENGNVPLADVLLGACESFYQAIQFFDDPVNTSEAALLLRRINKAKFFDQQAIAFARGRKGSSSQTENKNSPQIKSGNVSKDEHWETMILSQGQQGITPGVIDQKATSIDQDYEHIPLKAISQENMAQNPQRVLAQNKAADQHPEQEHDHFQYIPESQQATPTPANFVFSPTTVTSRTNRSWTVPSLSNMTPRFSSLGHPAFDFTEDTFILLCRKEACIETANAENPHASLCPRCGVFTYTRYCCVDHMYSDIRRHYSDSTEFTAGPECGRMHIPCAINELTIGSPIGPARPYIDEKNALLTEGYPKRIIERHRQAVYRSMNPEVDYFIFGDLDLLPLPRIAQAPIGYRKYHIQRVRGLGTVHTTITFPFPEARKQAFDQTITELLNLGFAAGTLVPAKCEQLHTWIVEELVKQQKWGHCMAERLGLQFGFEFGWKVPEAKRYVSQRYERPSREDEGVQISFNTHDLEDRLKYIAGGRLYP